MKAPTQRRDQQLEREHSRSLRYLIDPWDTTGLEAWTAIHQANHLTRLHHLTRLVFSIATEYVLRQ
jgi:hypothetical protein